MAVCAHCKKQETELYENGVPICIACANARDAKAKQGNRRFDAAANAASHSAITPVTDLQSRD